MVSLIGLMGFSTWALVLSAAAAGAALGTVLYGASINLDTAKKVAVALAEASKNGWAMAATVVDTAGDLVYFEKMDGTQVASVDVSVDKARSAARFKRPTKALQDTLAAGGEGLRILAFTGAIPVDGGVR